MSGATPGSRAARRGRPSGEKRQAILRALGEQRMAVRELALALQLSSADVVRTVDRMLHQAQPELVIDRYERVPWCSRPVAVLAPAPEHGMTMQRATDLHALGFVLCGRVRGVTR